MSDMIVWRAGRYAPEGVAAQVQDPQLLVTARLEQVARQNLGYFQLDQHTVLDRLEPSDPAAALVLRLQASGVYLVGEVGGQVTLWGYDPHTLRLELLDGEAIRY
jgi:hypothetical protein